MMILSCGHQIGRIQCKLNKSDLSSSIIPYFIIKSHLFYNNTFLTCSTQSRIMSPHDSTKTILPSENESKRHTHIPKWKKKEVQACIFVLP